MKREELLSQIHSLRAGLPVSGERRRLEILERQLTNGEITPEDAEREFREIEQEVNP